MLRFEEIIGRLQVHPEFRACAQDSRQQDRGLGRNAPLTIDDGVHALDRNRHALGQGNLTQVQRNEELREKDLSGM